MLPNLSIRDQITLHSSRGNKCLSEAERSKSVNAYADAIQEFVSSYKLALLLNSGDGLVLNCAFNLGAAYVAGGNASRGIDLLHTVLDQRKKTNQFNFPARDGDIYFNLALGHVRLQNPDKALELYFQALDKYSVETENQEKLCETHLKIAELFLARDDFIEAQIHFANAARLYHELGDLNNAAMSRVCQANAAIADVSVSRDDCFQLLEECCQECSKLNNNNLQAKIFCEVGVLFSELGYHKHALKCFKATIHLYGNNSNLRGNAVALQNAGAILNLFGQYYESVIYHSKAAQIHGKLGNRNAQGQSFCNLGFAESQLQNYETSHEAYLHSLQAFKDTGDKQGQWQSHEGLAAISYIAGDLNKAKIHYQMALLTQAKCSVINKASQERLVVKLTSVLESEVNTSTKAIEHPTLMVENGDQTERSSPEPDLKPEDFFIQESSPDNSARRRKLPRKNQTKKKYKGVRRQYSDENNRPIKHVARGLSDLTFTSTLQRDLEEESDTDLEIYNEEERPLSLQKRETLRKIFQKVLTPMETITDNTETGRTSTPVDQLKSKKRQGNDQLLQSSLLATEDEIAKEETLASARSDSSERDIAQVYRKQLSEINEKTDEDSFTSITSESSSDSTSDEGETYLQPDAPPQIKKNTPVKPKRNKLNIDPHGSDMQTNEPVYTKTIKSSTGNTRQHESDPGTSMHIYESIKSPQTTVKTHNEDSVGQSKEIPVIHPGVQNPSKVIEQDPPINLIIQEHEDDSRRSHSDNHGNDNGKFKDPPIYLHEPATPHVEVNPPPPSDEKESNQKNQPSRSCIVM